LVNSIQAHSNWINRIKPSPFNGSLIASTSGDATVKIWSLSSISPVLTLIRNYSDHTLDVNTFEYINADIVASGSTDGTIRIWSINTGQTLRTIYTVSGVYSLKLLSNGIHLAAGLNSSINIYNVNNGSLIASLKGHTSYVYDLVLSRFDLLASSSDDLTVRLWNLTTYTNRFILKGHTDQVIGLKQVSTDMLASGSLDSTLKLWNISNGQLIRSLTGHTDWVLWSVDLLEDGGQTLVSGSYDTTIKLWSLNTGQMLKLVDTGSFILSLAVINPTRAPTTTTTTSK